MIALLVVAAAVALGAGGIAWVVAAERATRRRRLDALQQVAGHLGGAVEDGRARASGTLDGLAIGFELAVRGSGSSAERWTYVDAALPPGYPLSLAVRSQRATDVALIERGALVDVVFDDPRFDAAFVVEGAPAEVVRRMLGPAERAFLLDQRDAELTSLPDRTLRLAIHHWLQAHDAAVAALEMTARLARAVRDASVAADREVGVGYGDGVYRPALDDRRLQADRAARAAEVAALEASRAVRATRAARAARIFAVGFVGVVIALLVVTARCT